MHGEHYTMHSKKPCDALAQFGTLNYLLIQLQNSSRCRCVAIHIPRYSGELHLDMLQRTCLTHFA